MDILVEDIIGCPPPYIELPALMLLERVALRLAGLEIEIAQLPTLAN